MKFIIILTSLAFISVLFACSSQKLSPEEYTKPKIIFGSGGGFAGTATSYCLTDQGMLYKKASINSEWELLEIPSNQRYGQCFSIIESINFKNMELNDPGNRYRFIDYIEQGESHKVLWGRQNDTVPHELEVLYKMLIGLIVTTQEEKK